MEQSFTKKDRPPGWSRRVLFGVAVTLVCAGSAVLIPATSNAARPPIIQTVAAPPVSSVAQAPVKAEPLHRAVAIQRLAKIQRISDRRALAAYLAGPAVQNQLLLASLRGPSPWDGVARCEEGGNWHFVGPTWSGGLGIANITWTAYMHGLLGRWRDLSQFGYPSNAGWATREQQIVVADRVLADHGGNPSASWGCGYAYGH